MQFRSLSYMHGLQVKGTDTRRPGVRAEMRRYVNRIDRRFGKQMIQEQLADIPTAAEIAEEKANDERKLAEAALEEYFELRRQHAKVLADLIDAIPENVQRHIEFDWYEGYHYVR